MKSIKININNYPHLKMEYIYNKNNDVINSYENENVVLFFTTLINSFGHSIIVGYHILYNYLINNCKSKILLPNISENHYYYQFINIFIPKDKIILIDYDKIYSFGDIIDYKIKSNIQLIGIKRNEFKQLNYINQLLNNKISLLNKKKYNTVFIYRNDKSSVFEKNRIFHNYDECIILLKKIFPDIYIFRPEEHKLEEQIFIMMNCSVLITDFGSSTKNVFWMPKNSTFICLVHPWLAYFGENQKNDEMTEITNHLKINYKICYCNTFYKNKLVSNKFIKRENTKESWNGKLNEDYQYKIDLNSLENILDNLNFL